MTVILCILDGWGFREGGTDNAIAQAETPHWDAILKHSPHTLLQASELEVGLPSGQMGNSEVGHMAIGTGRVIFQDLPRIDQAIADNTLATSPALLRFIDKLKQSKGTCHLLGLFSPGGVHSHEQHLLALAALVSAHGVPVALHAFLDGRDTPPQSAEASLLTLQAFLDHHPLVTLATMGGRYFGMDRDKRWDRIRQAYDVMVMGSPQTTDALTYLHEAYVQGITDEFIPPVALAPYAGMKDGDGLLMGNFRADRARQILTALLDSDCQDFQRPTFAATLGLANYGGPPMDTLFPPVSLQDTLGELVSHAGLSQLRIAETEKYAHVTFFFNGGKEEVFPGEDRILVPSPQVATYDLQPEMSAYELTDQLTAAILSQKYALIVANYANADMVGHTGNFEAACKAVETIDICLGRLKDATLEVKGSLLITADHGNIEQMCDGSSHGPHTAHTLNPVPFVLVNGPTLSHSHGTLADIAPTILELLHLPHPPSMTGHSLVNHGRG